MSLDIFLTVTWGTRWGHRGLSGRRIWWPRKEKLAPCMKSVPAPTQKLCMIWEHTFCARAHCPHSSRAVVNTRFHMRGQHTEVYPGGVLTHLGGVASLRPSSCRSASNRPAVPLQSRARSHRFGNGKTGSHTRHKSVSGAL